MVRIEHANTRRVMRGTAAPIGAMLVSAALAVALVMAVPTAAHAWGGPSGGMHGGGGGWHGGSMHSHDMHGHDHDHSFNSFSLSLGFPIYSGPAYYPYPYSYPYPAYYAPPAVVVPQGAPCQQGQWRQSDGSVVSGVACLGPDGNWRLAN